MVFASYGMLTHQSFFVGNFSCHLILSLLWEMGMVVDGTFPCPSIDSNLFVHLATVSLPQNTLTVIKFLSYYHLDHAIM